MAFSFSRFRCPDRIGIDHIPLCLVYTLLIATHFDTTLGCDVAVRGSRHDDKFRVFEPLHKPFRRPCLQLGAEHQYAPQASAACCKRRKSSNATTAPTTLRLHSRSVSDPNPRSLSWHATANEADALRHAG